MFPPDSPHASTARPLTRKRTFRVHLRCPYCDVRGLVDVEMRSEPRSHGSSEDFLECGGDSLIENVCAECGEEGIDIEDVEYLPARNEAPPTAHADV